jgi:indole-3-glycerol phosphate synthase
MEAMFQNSRSLRLKMADFLDLLVKDAIKTLRDGYYEMNYGEGAAERRVSLKEAIVKCKHAAIIAEIKPSSPSNGSLKRISNPKDVAQAMEKGGASSISVLTEPKHFGGSIKALSEVKQHVGVPVMMKDIIIDPIQIEAAARSGADAVLLILSIFERGYTDHSAQEMIRLAKSKGLETVLEVHDEREFLTALETDADLVGINNRDLRTLKVDLHTTQRVLSNIVGCNKIVISESGIKTPEDVRFLRNCGAKAFLVGSAFMLTQTINDIENKVKELVMAI